MALSMPALSSAQAAASSLLPAVCEDHRVHRRGKYRLRKPELNRAPHAGSVQRKLVRPGPQESGGGCHGRVSAHQVAQQLSRAEPTQRAVEGVPAGPGVPKGRKRKADGGNRRRAARPTECRQKVAASERGMDAHLPARGGPRPALLFLRPGKGRHGAVPTPRTGTRERPQECGESWHRRGKAASRAVWARVRRGLYESCRPRGQHRLPTIPCWKSDTYSEQPTRG